MAYTLPNPPIWQQNRKYSARLDRTFADVLFTEGVLDPGAGQYEVTQNALGLDNSVDVASGLAIIQGDDEANQGKYLVRLESAQNIVFGPPPTADARIDLLVLRVNDATAGSLATPANVSRIEVVEGVVDPSPVAPALPDTAIPLAEVLRTQGDTFIDNSMITDLRPTASQQSYTVNSRFEVLTTAERNALTPFVGQTIFNSDLNTNQFWDGGQWVSFGGTFFQAVTTAERNALTPFVGQTIFNTDTDEIQVWTGSQWDVVGVAPPAVDPIPLILALS